MKKGFIWFLIFIFLVSVSVAAYFIFRINRHTVVKIEGLHLEHSLKVPLRREAMVAWVMKHSLKGKMYRRLAEEIVDTCLEVEQGKFALLLLALMERESNFYVFNKSSAGALGLGQFTDTTIRTLIKRGVFKRYDDVFDPRKHIPAILVWLREKGMGENGENLERALIRYVGGSSKNKMTIAYKNGIMKNLGELYTVLSGASGQTKVASIRKPNKET